MTSKQILKLVGLNLSIVLINIILFSRGFIGISFNSAFTTALGITVIIMSIAAFIFGNYNLLFKSPKIKLYKAAELTNPKDYIDALEERGDKKVFATAIDTSIEQIGRLQQKQNALDTILKEYFADGEITFAKFQSVISATKDLFFNNVKKMINRITIFDYSEYLYLKSQLNGDLYEIKNQNPKAEIYIEHIEYVKKIITDNEDILTKFDELLLEISKLDDVDEASLESLGAIQEINSLISNTKYYKS